MMKNHNKPPILTLAIVRLRNLEKGVCLLASMEGALIIPPFLSLSFANKGFIGLIFPWVTAIGGVLDNLLL